MVSKKKNKSLKKKGMEAKEYPKDFNIPEKVLPPLGIP